MNRIRKQLIFSSNTRFQIKYLRKQFANNSAVYNENIAEEIVWNAARPFKQVPGDSLLGMLTNMLPGGRYHNLDITKLFSAMRDNYGDILLMPAMFGKSAMLVTYNPKDFEQIFRNEGIWPNRPGSEAIQYYREKYRADFFQGVEGLIATQGQTWGHFRSVVNPVLMQPKNVSNYLRKMSQVNMDFIECIKKIRDPETHEVPKDFEDYMNRWTLESVSVVALDKQLGLLKEDHISAEAALLFKSINDFFRLGVDIEFKPSLWRYITTPTFRKLMKSLDNIKNITSGFINESIVRLQNKSSKDANEESVFEKLLKKDRKIATVMAMDMLMAGVDTTSSALTGVLLNLAKHPEKQMKLRAEVARLLPEKDSEFKEDSFNNAPYLRACIKESMRVYPVVLGNMRVCQRNCVLSGYQVPKGTIVAMVPLLDNDKYFERANEYLPERWLRSTAYPVNELKRKDAFVYLPFGFGPRMCVGKRVVNMELEVGIARIIRNFNVEFNYSTENAFKALLINVPNIPLKFKFTDVP